MITFTVTLRGAPLRRTYVSHFDFFRVPQTMFFRTSEAGSVTVSNAGATLTADPTGPNGSTTVIVHAQNTVVRVLDGGLLTPFEVTQSFTVANGGTVNIASNAQQQDHFRILDICLTVYDTVFRQFRPFNRQGRRAFPFGQAGSVAATRDMLPRIEVLYPDLDIRSPGLAFVEPAGVTTGHPVVHIKHKAIDRRLFGVPDPVPDPTDPIPPVSPTNPAIDPTLIPHELAHALYFALMPATLRASTEVQYLAWIMSRVTAGLPPFHNTTHATSQLVAWLEALGIFSERFFFFSRRLTPPQTGAQLRQAFFRDKLSATPLLTNLTGHTPVGSLDAVGNVVPRLTGDNVEGAIYGAVFLDFARRVGLREAVGRYLSSGADNILTFDDFRNLIINDTNFDNHIIQVANTWGL